MANPTRENVHVNRPLTNMAMNYVQEQDKFIADRVLPYVGNQYKSDSYYKFDKNDLLRVEADVRPPGAESPGSGYRVSTDSFDCEVYAFHKDVSDQVRANSDSPLAPDQNATQFVTQNLLMKREILFGNKFLNYTHADYVSWDNEDSSSDWSDTGSDTGPIKEIQDAMTTIQQVWAKPNVIVMGVKVYNELKHHSDFLDRYKHTQAGVLTKDLLAQVIEIDNLYVSDAIYSSSNEGASATEAFCIPEDTCLIAYAPPAPQIDLPSAGYTFGWEGLSGADGLNITVKQFRMEELASDRIEGEMAFDMKQTSSALGYLFYNITLS